jgi:4-diphosphocytidyl-2-C-methyl-D-erythritol kinase
VTEAPLHERASAKLNLGLRILGRRPDGYHELDSLFVRLALADTLELAPLPRGGEDRLVRTPAGDAWLDAATLPLGPENLVMRALRRYRELADACGVEVPPCALTLQKRIPWGAGLAGGSADAAATLRLLARGWPAGIDLAALAAELGSDVPFSLANLPAARVGGRGERVAPVVVPELTLLLLYPRVAVATPAAFAWWGEDRTSVPPFDVDAWRATRTGPIPNALEAPVAARVPAVARALAALRSLALGSVAMSGSGSTCYLVLRDGVSGEGALAAARALTPDAWLALTAVA